MTSLANIFVVTITEVPVATRIQLCGEGRTLQPSDVVAALPKFSLSDHSSSPSGGVIPIPKWGVAEKDTTSGNIREHAKDVEFAKYPESIFAPPTFDAASGYLPSEFEKHSNAQFQLKIAVGCIVPRLPVQSSTTLFTATLRLPKTLKEMANPRSAGSGDVTGAMARYEGMQSLVYSVSTVSSNSRASTDQGSLCLTAVLPSA